MVARVAVGEVGGGRSRGWAKSEVEVEAVLAEKKTSITDP